MTTDRMFKILARLSLIVVLALFQAALPTLVIAQTKATILGTVTNEKGELVPNAKITAWRALSLRNLRPVNMK